MRSHSVLLASNLAAVCAMDPPNKYREAVIECDRIPFRNVEPGPTLHRKMPTGKARRAALELWQPTSHKRRCPVEPYRTIPNSGKARRRKDWASPTISLQPDASRRETPRFFVYQRGNTDISFRNSVGTSERFLSTEPTISRRNGLVHSNPPQVQSGLSTVTTGDRFITVGMSSITAWGWGAGLFL